MKDFRDEILTGPWADLKPHNDRGAVFIVAEDLDLTMVGKKVADDDVATVGEWLKRDQLKRPTEGQVQAWERNDGIQFRFLIVAPYVLAQTIPH